MMKLQLSVCAKDLPSAASYCAVLYCGTSQVVGETGVCGEPTTDPVWNKLILLDADALADGDGSMSSSLIEVAVYEGGGESIIAAASFDIVEIGKSSQKVVAKRTSIGDGASKIGVHVQEQEQDGQLKLVLRAKDLPDTDFGLTRGFKRQQTDPIYEVYAANGKKVCRSNKVEDNLNPTWDPTYFDLDALCGGDMDAPLRVTVLDKDKGDATEYIGEVLLSVNQMLSQQQQPIGLVNKNGQPTKGTVIVQQATLLPQEFVSQKVKKTLEAVVGALEGLEEVKARAEEKTQAAKLATEKAATAQKQSDSRHQQLEAAAFAQEQAKTKLAELEQATKQASEAAKERECTGKLQFQLRAEDLPDTDGGIRLRNKTDPIYEMYSGASTKHYVHRSNIVEDNLNPTWDVSTVDLVALCDGNLNERIRIAIYDKDGGDDKDSLGFVRKSVNELLAAKPTDAMNLERQPKGAKGKVFVAQAELVDFKDLAKEAENLKEASEKAKKELEEAMKAWRSAQDEAELARQAADQAAEEAEMAQDEAEAAKLAVEMAQAAIG
jgi:methyl-accepting chemotaxis protein